jgi:amidase
MKDLWRMSATELAATIRDGEASAAEALDACIARIERINPNVNAVTTVHAEEARAAAAAADERQHSGEPLGPLHGVPVTVKENIDVAGWPTTLGVPAMKDAIAPRDAPIVANLRSAGAIPFAATNLPDFALRWYTDSSLHGVTRNPWEAARTPGGSSGGAAAALATGMGPLALGNDVGGSLRYPAQCCGIASLKPSSGRIARANATLPSELPLSFQLMYVEGPMARAVADLRVALEIASRHDARDPWWVPAPINPSPEIDLQIVAVCTDPAGLGVDPQVADGVRRAAEALERAGYRVEEAEPPHLMEVVQMWRQLLFTEIRASLVDVIRQVSSRDAMRSLELCEPFVPDLDKVGVLRALADRTRLFRDWLEFFEHYPLLLGPVSTARPFAAGDDIHSTERSHAIMDSQRLVVAINLFGLPTVVVPVGEAEGLPQAVQIAGPPFSDGRCLVAAEEIEQALGPLTPIDPR